MFDLFLFFLRGVSHRVSTALGYRAGRYIGDILESFPLNIENGKHKRTCTQISDLFLPQDIVDSSVKHARYVFPLAQFPLYSPFQLCRINLPINDHLLLINKIKLLFCFQQVTKSVKRETSMTTGEDAT